MKYDAVIVGASIAGLSTATHLAKAGWNVCIVDRRHEIGLPVRCGEATGNRTELARFTDIDESWIAGDIAGLAVHVNEGLVRKKAIRDGGVMLHRDRFEKHLAKKAVSSGATLLLDTLVCGLLRHHDRWAGVTGENGLEITADFIIGADGCESYVGRWAGITKPLRLSEIASTVQYRIKTDFCNDGYLHFFIGSRYLPHGYIWVFPKGNGMVLVGGALYRCRPEVPKVLFFIDRFIAGHITTAQPYSSSLIAGGIPVVVSPRKLSKDNVLLVGDAARQVNPLTAGGIMNALEASESAARYLMTAKKYSFSRVRDSYSREWARNQRFQHKVFLLLREIWFSTPDVKLCSRINSIYSLMKKTPDRSRPFHLPVLPLIKFLCKVFPLTLKHFRLLFT